MGRRMLGGALLLVMLASSASARGEVSILGRREVVPGVSTFMIRLPTPNVVYVVEITPSANVQRRVVSHKPGGDRLAPVTALCGGCLVAVNGGFFNVHTGLPVVGQWPVQLQSIWKSQTRAAPTSLMWLVKGGKVQPLTSDGFTLGRHPRTFAFGDASDTIWFASVDGRQPGYSLGMTLPEVASLAHGLGATWVVNLDGGCSTTFVVQGRVKNSPCVEAGSVRGRRPVADAFAVLPPRDPSPVIENLAK